MKRLVLIIALPLMVVAVHGQPRSCLRIMPIDELIRSSSLIVRVRVQKVSKANYRGEFNQTALLLAGDIIEGNTSLQQINVLSKSTVACANDVYVKHQEMLVFLIPEDSLYSTQNFQYGQFLIVDEIVKDWRDKENHVADKPYLEVRKEIEAYLKILHNQNQLSQPPPPIPVIPSQQQGMKPNNQLPKPAQPPPNGKPPLDRNRE